jgi:UTP--glucose-1-phosphate uridylyltransferase
MEINGPDISKYGVVVPNGKGVGISGLIEKPDMGEVPSNLASIGRYVLTPDIFSTLRNLTVGSGGEIQLADAINSHAQKGLVEVVWLNGQRFDCGSVDGFWKASKHEYQKRGFS